MCRIMGKALYEFGLDTDSGIHIMSMHDHQKDAENNLYFPAEIFSGFATHKTAFILEAVKKGRKAGVVIISHANLLLAGWLIKKTHPSTTIILLAHGLEIWDSLNPAKNEMLKACDKIICVSSYTAQKIRAKHLVPAPSITVLNNCLDPFLNNLHSAIDNNNLRSQYSFAPEDVVLLTLTRFSANDRYKGYEFVLKAMMSMAAKNKNIKYLLAGGSTKDEELYIKQLIKKYLLKENVVLTGYVPEAELATLFSMADIYIMPSNREGFGIVFIEAMYYGLPVIAGNKDGSTDALLDGKLGVLIEPNSPTEVEKAVDEIIKNMDAYKPNRQLLMENFGYQAYKTKLIETLYN